MIRRAPEGMGGKGKKGGRGVRNTRYIDLRENRGKKEVGRV